MASELRLARELTQILEHAKGRTLTFGDLIYRLGLQGQIVFLLLLVTPMLQPVPLPGISTVLSVMVVITGYQILFRLPPWLPQKLHDMEIDSQKLEKWMNAGLKIIARVEKICRPRSRWLGEGRTIRNGVAILVMLTSVLLALPLPIPLSNFFPSVTIFTLGLGLLEDDGLFYVFGFLFFLISAAYITSIFLVPWYLASNGHF